MFNWFKKPASPEKGVPGSEVAAIQRGDSVTPPAINGHGKDDEASHARFPHPNLDGTTSHSTKLHKPQQVAGYPPVGEGTNESLREFHINESIALKDQGNAHFENGKLAEAAACYRQAIALNPRYAEACTNLGFVFQVQGNLGEAVALYRKAVAFNPDLLTAHQNLGFALLNLGQTDAAEESLRRVVALAPEHAGAWQSLGVIAAQRGDLPRAETLLRRALELQPDYVEAHNNLGTLLRDAKRLPEAEACYRRVLELKPDFADAHYNLGSLLMEAKRLPEAEACYRRVLELQPDYIEAHSGLGSLLRKTERLPEAEACYRRALELKPDFADAHNNLGILLMEAQRLPEAEACFRRALELKPDFFEFHKNLGNTLVKLGRLDEAEVSLRRAIALNPGDADSFDYLGSLLAKADRMEESYAMFRRAQQIQPLITLPSRKMHADFSVLLLQSPISCCTPVNYLVGRTMYDSHFLNLIPDTEYDIDFLRTKADVVINLISDTDNGKDVLPFASDIADRIGRPTVNHPRHITGTDRETIASLLSGIALCHIPKTLRFPAAELIGADWHKCIEGFTVPLLIRCAGTHGGGDFEKIDDVGAIGSFVSRHPESDFYISEFVDYRSTDGYYRKYRLIFINDEILPYHLAIHDHWMVHHFRTDMANQEWMRIEEEAFLKDPHLVFSKEHYIALREVSAAIGLNYCGIDCSLDHEGNIVVFEANATMLVHSEKNKTFAYKNPYIAKIKEAFDAMLVRLSANR